MISILRGIKKVVVFGKPTPWLKFWEQLTITTHTYDPVGCVIQNRAESCCLYEFRRYLGNLNQSIMLTSSNNILHFGWIPP